VATDDLIVRAAIRDELSRPIGEIRRELADLRREAGRTERAMHSGGRSLDSYGLGLHRVRGAASMLVGGLTRTAKVAGVTLAAGAAATIAYTYKIGSAYQDTLNVFQSVTRANVAQMDQVRATAKQLGADMTLPATSAADAAAAMTELAKGGLSVDASMRAALGTLRLAAAAQVTGGQAAQIQVNALNQFSLSADKASMVADVLANTANAASGEITDVAEALKYAGPVASALKVSITDTSTAIGILANNGILGTMAGTALRGSLSALAKPSDRALVGMKKLGLQVFDNQGHFRGMRVLTDQLAQAKGRLSDKEFLAASAAAFGREPLAAINALAASGVGGWDKMSRAVGRTGGATDVAAAKSKGLHGALEGLRSQIETVAISLYERAAPGVETLVRGLATRLPGAADAAFTHLDRFAGRIEYLVAVIRNGNKGGQLLVLDELTGGHGAEAISIVEALAGFVDDLATILTGALLPALGDIAGVMPLFLTPLGLARELLGLMADHAGTTRVVIEALAIAYTANKVALFGLLVLDSAKAAIDWVKTTATAANTVATEANSAAQLTNQQRVIAGTVAVARGAVVMGVNAVRGAAQLVVSLAIVGLTYVKLGIQAAAAGAKQLLFSAASLAVRGALLAWTAAQWLLNAAMTANPIGIVVVAIALLAAGIYAAYRNSATFRAGVRLLWHGIQAGFNAVKPIILEFIVIWLRVEATLLRIFAAIVGAWLTVVGAIIHAAAKAFGWVPGIGGKLKTADRAFQAMKRGATDALNKTANAADHLADRLDKAARHRTATISVVVEGDPNVGHRVGRVGRPAPLYAGGPAVPGQTYLTGELRPELFVMPGFGSRVLGADGAELLRPEHPGYVYPSIAEGLPHAQANTPPPGGPGPGRHVTVERGGVSVVIGAGSTVTKDEVRDAVLEALEEIARDDHERGF
jgi:TP901 family phage tail tape measure protein